MVNILVTGGTGFVGSELVGALKKRRGFNVTVFDRTIKNRLPGVKYIQGNITNSEEVIRAVRGQDYVYHLAAILDESCQREIMFDVNVGGTVSVLEACRKNGSLKRLVYLSTDGVMAETEKKSNEKAPYGPRTNYQKSKTMAERTVLEFYRRYKLPVIIIRAALLYGPNSYWASIIRKAQDAFPVIGSGDNKWHILYIKNLIPVLVKARTKGKNGNVYLIADDEVHTYAEMYRILREELGVQKEPKNVPVWLAKLMALFLSVGRKKSIVSPQHIDRLLKNKWYDISKAKRHLAYRPGYNFNKGIRETIKYLRDKGVLKR
ncbi:MAG: NAD-dependent epimerase/dehydratase family protein [archaeon]|nr:MAG: NAD-dependent epimerase/dehydratase family protein [archaeon]